MTVFSAVAIPRPVSIDSIVKFWYVLDMDPKIHSFVVQGFAVHEHTSFDTISEKIL